MVDTVLMTSKPTIPGVRFMSQDINSTLASSADLTVIITTEVADEIV